MFDPRGGQWTNGCNVGSLVAAIGDVVERHMIDTGFLTPAVPIITKARQGHITGRRDLAWVRCARSATNLGWCARPAMRWIGQFEPNLDPVFLWRLNRALSR